MVKSLREEQRPLLPIRNLVIWSHLKVFYPPPAPLMSLLFPCPLFTSPLLYKLVPVSLSKQQAAACKTNMYMCITCVSDQSPVGEQNKIEFTTRGGVMCESQCVLGCVCECVFGDGTMASYLYQKMHDL